MSIWTTAVLAAAASSDIVSYTTSAPNAPNVGNPSTLVLALIGGVSTAMFWAIWPPHSRSYVRLKREAAAAKERASQFPDASEPTSFPEKRAA